MAGSIVGFDADEFRRGIHTAMEIGLAPRVEDQPTFFFRSHKSVYVPADDDNVPFNPTVLERVGPANFQMPPTASDTWLSCSYNIWSGPSLLYTGPMPLSLRDWSPFLARVPESDNQVGWLISSTPVTCADYLANATMGYAYSSPPSFPLDLRGAEYPQAGYVYPPVDVAAPVYATPLVTPKVIGAPAYLPSQTALPSFLDPNVPLVDLPPVRVPCAVEYHDGAGKAVEFGVVQATRVLLTFLDVDYAKVLDASGGAFSYVVIGGDRYFYSKTAAPLGLGPVGITQVWVTAEDDS